MNKTILSGRIGQTPEISQSGEMKIAKFSLATNDGTKTKPKTNWHNVVAFGKLAEIAEQYFNSGDQLMVVGKIDYNEYEKDGIKKYYTAIIMQEFDFGAKSNKEQSAPLKKEPSIPIPEGQPF